MKVVTIQYQDEGKAKVEITRGKVISEVYRHICPPFVHVDYEGVVKQLGDTVHMVEPPILFGPGARFYPLYHELCLSQGLYVCATPESAKEKGALCAVKILKKIREMGIWPKFFCAGIVNAEPYLGGMRSILAWGVI